MATMAPKYKVKTLSFPVASINLYSVQALPPPPPPHFINFCQKKNWSESECIVLLWIWVQDNAICSGVSVYFDWVRVGLSGMHLTSAVSNVSAICQMNLFLLDTTVGFSAVILGIKQLLTQFTISLEWLRSQEFILLLKSDAVQKITTQ